MHNSKDDKKSPMRNVKIGYGLPFKYSGVRKTKASKKYFDTEVARRQIEIYDQMREERFKSLDGVAHMSRCMCCQRETHIDGVILSLVADITGLPKKAEYWQSHRYICQECIDEYHEIHFFAIINPDLVTLECEFALHKQFVPKNYLHYDRLRRKSVLEELQNRPDDKE